MVSKNKSMADDTLASRVSKLEDDVDAIGQTVYDLIAMLRSLPEPPCPPMCSLEIFPDEGSAKKRSGKKKPPAK